MNKRLILILCYISFLFFVKAQATERKVNFDSAWKFHRGPVANAEQPDFDDSKWVTLDLPHDWSMDPAPVQKEGITVGPFSKLNEGGAGGADTGQTLGGEGWYRKLFTLGDSDAHKRITLYFEGVYNQSEIWVNGHKVSFNRYGYTSYKIDITDFCHTPGIFNTLAVKVVNVGENSRWYSGSGIYRHVWLIKTNPVYLEEWDTFVDGSVLKNKIAQVQLSTIIHQHVENDNIDLQINIISPQGKIVVSHTNKVQLSESTSISETFFITKPQLWSLETPQLYEAELAILSQGNLLDKISIPFGIRTIAFSAEKGFQLNGKTIKLKGGCIHHDNGLLGAAAIDRAEEKKIELLKENGFNAIRCAHNQVSEYLLEACDRLGMLVIHETFDQWQQAKRDNDYHQYFDDWSEYDLVASLRRDRNHPSIIMWSIGNEVAQRADPEGEEIAKRLVSIIHQYDTTRFSTIGSNDFWDRRHFSWDKDAYRAFRNVDIAGYNYMWHKYESDHQAYPERVMYGSETYPKDLAAAWNLVEKHPYIIGDFVWTAIDYLGEAGLAHALELKPGEWNPQFMGWPWYNAWCGDIDFCGDKKPQSYYRDIIWREKAITMAVRRPVEAGKQEVVNGWGWTDELISWNWQGYENQAMRVNVYSRSPKVRLYLNDVLIGEQETDKENYTASFEVPYQPGILKAVNLNKKKETETFELQTSGKPASIRLTADRTQLKANKNDLSYVQIEIIDENGKIVPDADNAVNISSTGQGMVIAAGNASMFDMHSFRSMKPRVFRGKALAIVQPDGKTGIIELTVKSEGLPDASIQIMTQ